MCVEKFTLPYLACPPTHRRSSSLLAAQRSHLSLATGAEAPEAELALEALAPLPHGRRRQPRLVEVGERDRLARFDRPPRHYLEGRAAAGAADAHARVGRARVLEQAGGAVDADAALVDREEVRLQPQQQL